MIATKLTVGGNIQLITPPSDDSSCNLTVIPKEVCDKKNLSKNTY